MPVCESLCVGPTAEHLDDAKRVLRSRMRAVCRVIGSDPGRREDRSRRLCANLIAIVDAHLEGRADGRRAMVFEPWRTEPDLAVFVAWCADRRLEVYVPEVAGDEMWAMPGRVAPATLDVVVVPGLAFARDGRRLGRGRGHYDRFLATVGPRCLSVGVGFAEQLVDDVPTAEHDVRLDAVVTDTDR